jgi:Ca2+-transporting ATPase
MADSRAPHQAHHDDDSPAWHTLAPKATLDRIESSADGLTGEEAQARFERYGPNRGERQEAASVFGILLDQVRSVVVALLGAATLVAWLMGEAVEAIAILAVLVLNTLIGFVVELRARRAMEALLGLEVGEATVIRDGQVIEVDASTLVPGDIIILETGGSVPADARLLEANELRANEAPLTGESSPADKIVDAQLEPDTPVADRDNMVYKATAIVNGDARAVVVATGKDTEVGRIGQLTSGLTDEKTPLEVRLDALGRRLVWVTLAIAAVVIGIGLLRGFEVLAMVEAGVALAIAAVPEGLPAVATITLGLGLRRMAKRNALIRRLPAVEALGSATTICTDKTGTLTAGLMAVTRLRLFETEVSISGTGYAPEGTFGIDGREIEASSNEPLMTALRIGVLTNRSRVTHDDEEGWSVRGDPTEAALIVAGRKAGLERDTLIESFVETNAVPFSSERRYMATTHETPDGTRTFVKGDPARLLGRCTLAMTDSGVVELGNDERDRLETANDELARNGLRVLALAFTESSDAEADLTFVALAGMMDPPVAGVEKTIAQFQEAGIRIVMITGDQRPTAEAIALELGIMDKHHGTLDGRDLTAMDDATLTEQAGRTAVFCRVSPFDKLRIVTALQERGEIVAMLGDGVNDAAALKKAAIGVAMGGRGTDVAREAADVVLTDDRFQTIGAAIEEGRVIFDNIRKFVFYLFSCNLAEVLVLMLALLAGLPLPLLPLQILWLNLVTDTFPAFALALEPAEPGVMQRPPRDPDGAFLSRGFMIRVATHAGVITIAALGAFIAGLSIEPDHAVTMCFLTLAFAQILHLGNARSRDPVLSPGRALANRWAIGAVILSGGLQVIAVTFAPLRELLRVEVLPPRDWLIVIGLSLTPAIAGQVGKLFRARRLPTAAART